jgi:hypothetical protein
MLDDVEDDAPYVEGQRDELVPVCAEHLVDYMTTHGGMSSHRCDEYGNDTRDPGTIRISVCERAIERYAAMALMKRSPKMTAN